MTSALTGPELVGRSKSTVFRPVLRNLSRGSLELKVTRPKAWPPCVMETRMRF